VEAFSHCLTIIFNLFNESWYPVRPFYRLVSFKSTVVSSSAKIFAADFRHYSQKLAQKRASVNMLTIIGLRAS